MHGDQLFEYAVIRVVPRVEREEFVNVGVALLCRSRKFLGMRYIIDSKRLLAFDKTLDLDEVAAALQSFEKVCAGGKEGGPIGELPAEERFRWLTATRSTVLQASKVHPGMCGEPEAMLDRLFEEMVL